jgi:dolichyl-phosphate-mannose-protein mannosyltransferase
VKNKKITLWEPASVLALILLFLFFASLNLGSITMPSSCWLPSQSGMDGREVVIDLGSVQQVKEVYIFVSDAKRTKFDLYGDPGNEDSIASYDNNPAEHVHFSSWERISIGQRSLSSLRFVFAPESVGTIGEILIVSTDNKLIEPVDVTGESAIRLVDEQHAVTLPLTQKHGAYFDEMYFVRTAEEHLNLEEPYESTHPPLGKLILSFGIICFGMNPFGWRILGVLTAAAMIPLMFLFGKRLFKSGVAGFFAAFLLTFDFMHFTLARLATGEIYIMLLSLLIFYFALDYLSKQEEGGITKGAPLSLFISIIFFGLCFAVKWTAVFSLLAILVLLLVSNIRNRKPIFSGYKIVLAGLFISALIYLATYIPYMLSGEGHALLDIHRFPLYLRYLSDYLATGAVNITPPVPLTVLDVQLGMFCYHSLLSATHPFSSPWWSWPLMLKPLWIYSNTWDGMVSTIVLMGNPAIWGGSIPALILIAARLVRGKIKREKGDFAAIFILIPFLLLWLPYAFISRILFIYHYAPIIPFLICAITYWLHRLWQSRSLEEPQLLEKEVVLQRMLVIAFLIVTAFLFLLFYPVISGYPVSYEYKESLKWLSGWIF